MIVGIPTMLAHSGVKACIDVLEQHYDNSIIIVNNSKLTYKFSLPEQVVFINIADHLGKPLSVGASWNYVMRRYYAESEWMFVNDDFIFHSLDDFYKLLRYAARNDDHDLILTKAGFACFIIRKSAIAKIGYFDENFFPAYYEDCDYMYRAKLAGAKLSQFDDFNFTHCGSATIKNNPNYNPNVFPFPFCIKYYEKKWGGDKGHEVFETPFNL